MSNTLNLIYSKRNSPFFKQIASEQHVVLKRKELQLLPVLADKDHQEVGRGLSYAIFPELKASFENDNQKITVEAIRKAFAARGVTDEIFQNKIIFFLLQSRSGIGFALGNTLNTLFDFELLLSQEINFRYEIQDNNCVKLVFEGSSEDLSTGEKTPGLTTSIQLTLTPDKLVIDKFAITKVGQTPTVNEWFAKLESTQVNFLQKFIQFLKNYLIGTPELELENETQDKQLWKTAFTQPVEPTGSNSPKI